MAARDDQLVSEARPPAIEPDDKNWTWVLDRPCPECGFVAGEHPWDSLGAALRQLAGRYDALLADPRVGDPPVAAGVVGTGVRLSRPRRVRPLPPPTGADARRGRPDVRQLGSGRDRGRRALRPAGPRRRPSPTRRRIAPRSPIGSTRSAPTSGRARAPAATVPVFTIETFGVYFLHDPVHHLYDVEQGYAALS